MFVDAVVSNRHAQLEFLDLANAFVREEVAEGLEAALAGTFERHLMVKASSRATVSGMRFIGTCGPLPLEQETQRCVACVRVCWWWWWLQCPTATHEAPPYVYTPTRWIPDERVRRLLYTLPQDRALANSDGWGAPRALLTTGLGMSSRLMARVTPKSTKARGTVGAGHTPARLGRRRQEPAAPTATGPEVDESDHGGVGAGEGGAGAGDASSRGPLVHPAQADWSRTPMGGDPLRYTAVRSPSPPTTRLARFRKHAQLARARRRLPWRPYTANGKSLAMPRTPES